MIGIERVFLATFVLWLGLCSGGGLALAALQQNANVVEADVVIYGGTSAGVTAAIQVTRMGRTALIVEPGTHLGGLTSGGLGWTDSGREEVVGGLAREFYRAIKAHYDVPAHWKFQRAEDYSRYRRDSDAMWTFEPHVAEQIFDQWVAQAHIRVLLRERLDRTQPVAKTGTRLTELVMESGLRVRGRIFLDCTYEGDLLAASGVTYVVGRESNATYGESINGVQTRRTVKHQFDFPVSPFRIPNDPASGLLKFVSPEPPGVDGTGDHRVQAYCYRMCLTDCPENRIPLTAPENYDRQDYELLGRYLAQGWNGVFNKFDPIPNRKTDTNNHGAFSFDYIGMNYQYPEADYATREQIARDHERYQQGLLWFLQQDQQVPPAIRQRMQQWGLCWDEFPDTGGWPHQLYVREARRMVGQVVITEQRVTQVEATTDSIGMGSYNIDSHNTQRYITTEGLVRNEGDVQISPGGPYPISLGSVLPKATEVTNLAVPVCVSASHVAYGSIRMEPVFMILGQSAGTLAVLALESDRDLQAVPYAELRPLLLAQHQVLETAAEKPRRTIVHAADLPGIVVDDSEGTSVGNWSVSGSLGGFVGSGYRHNSAQSPGEKSFAFEATVTEAGRYSIGISCVPSGNRDRRIPIRVVVNGDEAGARNLTVDGTAAPPAGTPFTPLGAWTFPAQSRVRVTVGTTGTTGHVIADAIQLLPLPDSPR